MPHPPLEAFVAEYQADIDLADDMVRRYVRPDNQSAPLISTVIGWYRDLDVEALRDRARILERLAPTGDSSVYDMIFESTVYEDAHSAWTGKGGDAFFRYCKGSGDGEASFRTYVDRVRGAVQNHYTALEGIGDGSSGVVVLLQKAQNDFAELVKSQFAGFRAKIDNNYEMPTSIDPPQFAVDVILSVYRANIKDAETIDTAGNAVAAHAELMTNNQVVDLNETGLGPTGASILDKLPSLDGGWKPS